MNLNIQSKVYRVTRGTFVNDQTGEYIEYAKAYVLQSVKNEDNDIGLDIQGISIDPDLFDDMVKYYKDGTNLSLHVELKPNNGLLKPKITSVIVLKQN